MHFRAPRGYNLPLTMAGVSQKTMRTRLDFAITPQPTETTCGPACLYAVYRYYNDDISSEQVFSEVQMLPGGGTLTVFLALHAMRRGYDATIFTCNLQMFDPTWFTPAPGGGGGGSPLIRERLIAQKAVKNDPKLHIATDGYLQYLDEGGQLFMEDITPQLIDRILDSGAPIIAGLSATWLYRAKRDRPDDMQEDDIAGEPLGHFVVIHGLDASASHASVADPYMYLPTFGSHSYIVPVDRLISAILLGIFTYDAKLLILTPGTRVQGSGFGVPAPHPPVPEP